MYSYVKLDLSHSDDVHVLIEPASYYSYTPDHYAYQYIFTIQAARTMWGKSTAISFPTPILCRTAWQ